MLECGVRRSVRDRVVVFRHPSNHLVGTNL